MSDQKKLLIIGIDAMDARITSKLLHSGVLPNFKKLSFSKLATTIPPETPVAWSAAATGANPGRYGIFDFLARDIKTYLPRLNLTEEKPGLVKTSYKSALKGRPFWKVLSEKKVPVSVLRWPVSFPPDKITGNMLSGLGVVDIKGSLNGYSFYTNNKEFLKGEGKEKVVILDSNTNTFETELAGPLIRKKGELNKITIPMTIELIAGGVEISVGENRFKLLEGKWSPIVRVKFKPLAFHEISGICNFHLISAGSELRLYASSIQVDPGNQAVPISYPESYGKELSEAIGLFYTLGMAEDTKAVTDGKLPKEIFIEQVLTIEQEREKMFWFEFNKFKHGVLAVVFDAGDRLNHICWQNQDLQQGGFEVPKEIEDYYIDKDRLLGEVLSKLDADTELIVLSDHGFSNFTRQVNINNWLVSEGYMTVSDKADTELFAKVDWSESVAYSLGFTSIFLNLDGREKKGIVPIENKQGILDEMTNKLKNLKDGKQTVVSSVYRGEEVYQGKYAGDAPDLVVGFMPGYRMSWKSALGALEDSIFSDNDSPWQGDHLIDPVHVPGVLFSSFSVNSTNPKLIDIAPTIYNIMEVDCDSEEIDGESLV